ncbi:hypothetical protein EVAR_3409_1 [Eumeta japonica]|uniref:Uncharacterized protein n=1 Tax=Eumeta variegata TaxID=151549 RepID=A0A4C1SSH1_EUMVA|nr:hypothetical protein EVAR_3409_1 [Eumeta japonica]
MHLRSCERDGLCDEFKGLSSLKMLNYANRGGAGGTRGARASPDCKLPVLASYAVANSAAARKHTHEAAASAVAFRVTIPVDLRPLARSPFIVLLPLHQKFYFYPKHRQRTLLVARAHGRRLPSILWWLACSFATLKCYKTSLYHS